MTVTWIEGIRGKKSKKSWKGDSDSISKDFQ